MLHAKSLLQLKMHLKGTKCATQQRLSYKRTRVARGHANVCFGEISQRVSKSREELPLVKSDSFYLGFFFQMRMVQTT